MSLDFVRSVLHAPNERADEMIKGKGTVWNVPHVTAKECHLPHGITHCRLPPDTSEHTQI